MYDIYVRFSRIVVSALHCSLSMMFTFIINNDAAIKLDGCATLD